MARCVNRLIPHSRASWSRLRRSMTDFGRDLTCLRIDVGAASTALDV